MEKRINTKSDQRACAYTDDKSTNTTDFGCNLLYIQNEISEFYMT